MPTDFLMSFTDKIDTASSSQELLTPFTDPYVCISLERTSDGQQARSFES